jgi:hypothetical protein
MVLKKKPSRPNPFSVPLGDDLMRFVKKHAKKSDVSMSEFVRMVLAKEMIKRG